MDQPHTLIKPSAIQGRGVFATTSFRKNQRILTADGPTIMYTQPFDWRLGPHWINVARGRWIVPSSKSIWRYLNHSCHPSAIITERQKIIALRSIRLGEEITIDYSFTESYSPWHMPCQCGARSCRKIIRSIQYLPEPLYQKYRHYVRPFLRREYAKIKFDIQNMPDKKTVVAKRRLRKGEAVFKVVGPVIIYHKPPNYWLGYRWLGIGVNSWIIPEESNPWNYMNHSCDPNTGLNDRREVVALKRIKQDEELTIDNSITEADPRWRMQCRCGTKNCRGIIRSVQFLPTNIFQKYLPNIPLFMQQIHFKTAMEQARVNR